MLPKSAFFAVVSLLTAWAPRVAAETTPVRLGAYLSLEGPTGEHAAASGAANLGGGVSWCLGMWSRRRWLPLYGGIDFGFSMRHWSTEERPLVVLLPEGPRQIGTVDVTRKSGSLHVHAVGAVRSPWELPGAVTPFAEALFGIRHFISQMDFDVGDVTHTTSSDTALSHGFGGGLIFRMRERGGPDSTETHVTLGLRFFRGGRASYLTRGGDMAPFVEKTTRTDSWMLTLGVGGVAR